MGKKKRKKRKGYQGKRKKKVEKNQRKKNRNDGILGVPKKLLHRSEGKSAPKKEDDLAES